MGIGRKAVAASFALVLLATGCGKIADKAGQKIGEKVAESASGCDKVDVSDKGVSAKCNGNSVSVDSNGNVKSSDANGDTGTFGAGSKLPDDWPAELAPPKGTKILLSSSNTVNGNKNFFVVAAVPGDVQSIAGGLKSQLTSAGYEIANDSTSDMGGTKTASLSAKSSKYTAAIVISDSLAGSGSYQVPKGSVGVTFTLSPLAG